MPRTTPTAADAILALKDEVGDVIEVEPGGNKGNVFIEILTAEPGDTALVLLRRKDVKRLRKALKKAARA